MISVITPIFNCAPYLERMLNCLRSQTYKEFEIIIVDDASEDSSQNTIQKWIMQGQLSIHYHLFPVRRGASAARNYGAKIAQGELLCFLDGDDIISPDFLASFNDNFKKTHFDVCFCKYQILDERQENKQLRILKNNFSLCTKSAVYIRYLTGRIVLCHCTAMYKRQFLLDSGLFYTEGCQCAEDTEFVSKALFSANKISLIDSILYTYCQHIPSLSHSKPDERILAAYSAMCRAQSSVPLIWRPLFALTKRARIHGFILEQFMQSNTAVPYHYCTMAEVIMCLFLSSLLAQDSKKHREVFKALMSGQIKFEN